MITLTPCESCKRESCPGAPRFKGLCDRPARLGCMAPRDKDLSGIFGERCSEPAMYRDSLGRPLCAECATLARKANEDGETLFSLMGRPYLLVPIH